MRELERLGRDRRRSQLGRVAIDVAAIVGYDAMSIADIADAAGVVRRTFSRHFADKQVAFEFGYREVSEAAGARSKMGVVVAGDAMPGPVIGSGCVGR